MNSCTTYRNQSIATIKAISSVGRPKVCNMTIIVTKRAYGIPAVPSDPSVAVILKLNTKSHWETEKEGLVSGIFMAKSKIVKYCTNTTLERSSPSQQNDQNGVEQEI